MNCRHCHSPLDHLFLDLGFAPPSNAFLTNDDLSRPEQYLPLRIYICDQCWLVQTADFAGSEDLFCEEYAYFSSISATWMQHAADYCSTIIDRLGLNASSFVVEVASNDGYLLKNLIAAGIPCLGIEPTAGTAEAAGQLGIPVIRDFFGKDLGRRLEAENQQADLIIGNNVLAHVPDINDFVAGLKIALKPSGTITLEFPYLLNLIAQCQFDTIYHEHFSYLSLFTSSHIFEKAGLRVWDVEEISTHGGSLRIYGCHQNDARVTCPSVAELLNKEMQNGLKDINFYRHFQPRVEKIKDDLLLFLIEQKRLGKTVAAYGAAAKGNTLLNFAGIKSDLISFVCDAAKSKQGKYLPGSHIPIFPPKEITEYRPDYVMILPWNIKEEIIEQLDYIQNWGGRFVTAIPKLELR